MRKIPAFLALAVTAAWAASAADVLDANKTVARRIVEQLLGKGRFELVSELYAPDFVNHGRTTNSDLAEDQRWARGWRQAFPDLEMTTEVLVAEGDLVGVVWRGRGTNTGQGNGLPATGGRIDGRALTIWRVAGGKVTEEWAAFSTAELLQQLGLMPGGSKPDGGLRPSEGRDANVRGGAEERERTRRVAVQAVEEILGGGKLGLFETIYAKGCAFHVSRGEGTLADLAAETRGLRQLAPDLRARVTLTVAEGNTVALVYNLDGTNTGAALGYPATGKPLKLRGMKVMRVADGRITDEWSVLDHYQILKQLGLIPPPPTAKPAP